MPTQQTRVDVSQAALAADASSPVRNTIVPGPSAPSASPAAPNLAVAGYNPVVEAAFGAIFNRNQPAAAATTNPSIATMPTICNTMPKPGLTAFAPLANAGKDNPVAEAAIEAIFNKRQLESAPSPTKPTKKRRTKACPITGPGTGPWTDEEELAFRRGCILHGTGSWAAISKVIPTGRSPDQVKSHAQKVKDYHPELWDELVKRSQEGGGGDVASLKSLDDFISKRRFVYGKDAKKDVKKKNVKLDESWWRKKQSNEEQEMQEEPEVESMEAEQNLKKEESKRLKAQIVSYSKRQHISPETKSTERKPYTRKSAPTANMWTTAEHSAFRQACKLHGIPNWSKIAEEIPTRNATQVKSHAQKIKIHRPEEWDVLVNSYTVGRKDYGKRESKSTIDDALESAGTLLLLASGNGGQPLVTTDETKADTSNEASSLASSSTSESNLERKLEDSNNETSTCRSIMGYDVKVSCRGGAKSSQHSITLRKVSDSTDEEAAALDFVTGPRNGDVLCGRGGRTNRHIGNSHWRALVCANKRLYLTLPKEQKSLVAKSIVHAIRSQQPPGRFLQKNNDGTWHDIGDRRAYEKTSQRLRDGAAEIRTGKRDEMARSGQILPNGLMEIIDVQDAVYNGQAGVIIKDNEVADSTDGDSNGSLLPDESLAAKDLVVISKQAPYTGKRGTSSKSMVKTKLVQQQSNTSDTANDHNLSLSALRTILSGLNPSELFQVLPSTDSKEIKSLQSENESLKATIEKLQLKLAMEKRRNDFKRPAVNGSGKDASARAGLSALKARGGKAGV